jgi:small-conductance mechanosensitive channel
VLYALRFFIADPMQNISICSEVQASIWEAFKANGIEIPFPQRVNHRAGGAEVEATASPATDEDR